MTASSVVRLTFWCPPTAEGLSAAIEGLTAVNALLLREGWVGQPLYESGVVYRRERKREDWLNVRDLYARGFGDCEDLAAARAAELRVFASEPARAVVRPTKRNRTWHAVVKRADGTTEDPSKILLWLERKLHRGR